MAVTATARKYNPGFLTDDELVGTFCVRTTEFEILVEVLRECTGASNPHQIVIGPRGSGKTSLLLRVAAEVRRDPGLAAAFFPVVFAEESYEVSTAGEFWLECLSHLAVQTPRREDGPDLQRTFAELRTVRDDRELAERCLGALLDFSDREDKRLVLLVENLNMLFRDMTDPDAGWRLRKVLQTEPRIVLLASATSRFDEIDDPKHALYDLFSVRTLRPLDTGECATLWEAVAGRCPQPGTIRSIEILTGGSARLVAIVARFGAELSFRTLMASLLDLIDDHTEYFKSHLELLPAQERRVYLALAALWKPATTREIADQSRMETSKCSAQLTRLTGRGVVQSAGGSARRKQYYLTERLYNIYYLLRRSRRSDRLVEALIHFMESYYSPSELKDIGVRIIREAESFTAEMQSFAGKALVRLMALPAMAAYRGELLAMIPEGFAKAPEEEVLAAVKLLAEGFELNDQDRAVDALAVYGEVVCRFGKSGNPVVLEVVARALVTKADVLTDLNRLEEALATFDEAVCMSKKWDTSVFLEMTALALFGKGISLMKLNRVEDALFAYEEIEHRFGRSDTPVVLETFAKALVNKGSILDELDRSDEALAVFDDLIHRLKESDASILTEQVAAALFNKGVIFDKLNRTDDTLATYDEIERRFGRSGTTEILEVIAKTLVNKGSILGELDRSDEALTAFDDAVRLLERSDVPVLVEQAASALFNKGVVLRKLERKGDVLATYDELETRFGKSDTPAVLVVVARALVNKASILGELSRFGESLEVCNHVVRRFGASAVPEILEEVAKALYNKGVTFHYLSQPEDALSVCRDIVDRFGSSEHPALRAWVEFALLEKGRIELSCERYEAAIETADRVIRQISVESHEKRLRGLLIRARATLACGDRSACERDVEEALAVLPEIDSFPMECLDPLIFFGVALGPERLREIIKASPAESLLLPLTTALEGELGLASRVAREIEEVAEDIRSQMAELSQAAAEGIR